MTYYVFGGTLYLAQPNLRVLMLFILLVLGVMIAIACTCFLLLCNNTILPFRPS